MWCNGGGEDFAMADQLPVRKYVQVWVMRRKNNVRKDGKPPTVSYTLQWAVYGQKSVLSLGRGATLAYAKEPRRNNFPISSWYGMIGGSKNGCFFPRPSHG